MLKVLELETHDEVSFLVFGVPNAKYLVFGALDIASTLSLYKSILFNFFINLVF